MTRTLALALTASVALTASTALLAVPASAAPPQKTADTATTLGTYGKPGAPVDFMHRVEASGADGVDITLDLLEALGEGAVDVRLHVPDGVSVSGPLSTRFDAGRGERHSFRFRATSEVEGLHHIGVTAEVDGEMRSYAVPVQIGFGGLVRKGGGPATVANGRAVFEAAETIDGEPADPAREVDAIPGD